MNKQTQKCLNEFNDFYLKEFEKLSKDARDKNNKNLLQIYKKVCHSISKYPFPILSSSQATLLEGVGETISKTFEKLIQLYREKIEIEEILYLEMAYNINQIKNKKNGKRKAQTESESESKKSNLESRSELKKRKKLVNIEMYSSVWSSVVSSYIVYLQNNSVILEIEDVMAMSKTLSEELKSIKKIEISQGLNDLKQMRILNLIESIELKEKKIKITEFCIKLAKIELRKSGILVEQDESGSLNFEIVEPEVSNIEQSTQQIPSNFESNNNCNININTLINPINKVYTNSNNNIFNNSSHLNNNLTLYNLNINRFNYSNNNINNGNLNRSSLSSKMSLSNISNSSKSKNFIDNSKNLTLDSFLKVNKKYKEEEINNMTLNINNNNDNSNNIPAIRSSLHNNSNETGPINYSRRDFSFSGVLDVNINKHNNYNENNVSNIQNVKQNKLLQFKKSKSKILKENIILIVDNREKGPKGEKFPEEIKKLRPDILIREGNLAIGDFMWIYIDDETGLEFVFDFIIERKTIDDLAKSILDGRYHEQKYRLKNCGIKNIYYMFEGNNFNLPRGNISKSAIVTAIFNTINIHDINIIKTSSIEDSVNYLIKLNDFISKSADLFMNVKNVNNSLINERKCLFSEFTQFNAKTKNSTIENIFVRQLRCFDDCGAKSVDIVRRVFKCPRFIYDLMQNIRDEEMRENVFNPFNKYYEYKILKIIIFFIYKLIYVLLSNKFSLK